MKSGRRGWAAIAARVALALVGVAIAIGIGEVAAAVLTRAAPPSRWMNHAIYGHWLRAHFRLREAGREFVTDADGIIERPAQRRNAGPTVLFLGDSMLEGLTVPPERNISERIAARWPGRCIAIGVSGWSPVRHLLTYRHLGRRFKPRYVVMVLYVLNDFNDDARLFHLQRLRRTVTGDPVSIEPTYDCELNAYWHPAAGWMPMAPQISMAECGLVRTITSRRRQLTQPPARRVDFSRRNEDLIRTNIHSVFKSVYEAEDREDVTRTVGYVEALARAVHADGASFHVVIMPYAGQIAGALVGGDVKDYGQRTDEIANDRPQEALRGLLSRAGVSYLDLLPVFREHGAALFGERDKHLSPIGHEVTAAAIYRAWLAK